MSALINPVQEPVVPYIINHDIIRCTADGVVGNHLYSARALGISFPWDMIQLHPDLKILWDDICHHYANVGLRHTHKVIWDINPDRLGKHIGFYPSVFYFGPEEFKHWGDNAWLETVEYINSKNNFIELAHELSVPVPHTDCFSDVGQITSSYFQQLDFPCYFKAAISVSGVGIFKCNNKNEFLIAMGQFEKGVPIQVQEQIETATFLNMQYKATNNGVERLCASEQILNGFEHQGNRFPTRYQPWHIVDSMADKLYEMGIKGIFAFDVAVLETDSETRFSVIECNPRFNGATYPTLIAEKLGIPKWTAINLSTKHRTLKEINLSDLEYDSTTGEGLVVINWGTILEGKIAVLLAGSPEYQEVLTVELASRL